MADNTSGVDQEGSTTKAPRLSMEGSATYQVIARTVNDLRRVLSDHTSMTREPVRIALRAEFFVRAAGSREVASLGPLKGKLEAVELSPGARLRC